MQYKNYNLSKEKNVAAWACLIWPWKNILKTIWVFAIENNLFQLLKLTISLFFTNEKKQQTNKKMPL